MSEKIIDEVMGLVKYACDSYAHLCWCKDNAEHTEAIQEELEQDLEAIRDKLREVLERKPLTAFSEVADFVADNWPMGKRYTLQEIEEKLRAHGITQEKQG